SIVDADRAKWDYHPVMARGGKAGQGLFYQAAPSKDFRGMVQLMKNYVKTRAEWIDGTLLGDPKVPMTPIVTYAGTSNYPSNHLSFHCSDFKGTSAFAAMKWRVGEILDPTERISNARNRRRGEADPYEIRPIWEGEESTAFTSAMTLPSGA